MPDSSPEVARFDLFARDPDIYDEWMHAAYVDYQRRLWGDLAGRSFSLTGAAVDEFSIAVAHYGMQVEFLTETFDGAIMLSTTLSGRVSVSGGDMRIDSGIGQPYLMPPGRPWVVHGEAYATRAVKVEKSVLDTAASGLGWRDGDIRFAECVPLPQMENYLRSTIAYVDDHVLNGFDPVPQLAIGEAARSLATAALLTYPSNALDALTDPAGPPAGSAEPATVRRAVEFIDAHAHEDIDIAQIAEASRTGARGLQQAFRKHRGQAPLEYLRQVRMDGAHRDLLAANPTRGDTVAAIAARWGFSHPGRFSVEYRQVYGRSPRHTLRE